MNPLNNKISGFKCFTLASGHGKLEHIKALIFINSKTSNKTLSVAILFLELF